MPDEKEVISEPFELLEESLRVKGDIKVSKKAMEEASTRISDQLKIDKGFVKEARKLLSKKGAEKGDVLSSTFEKLATIISVLNVTGMLDELNEYLSELEGKGIKISIENKNESAPPSVIEDFKDVIAYLHTIDEYQEEITSHSTRAEELNFSPKKEYKQLLSMYERRLKGKDVEDKVQDKITYCTMTETAWNIVHDKEIR